MKLLPAYKSAKAVCLAAMTIATAIATSNVTPILAETTPATELNSIPTTRPGRIFLSNNALNTTVSLSITYTVNRSRTLTTNKNIVAPGKVLLSTPFKTTKVFALVEYSSGSGKPIVLFQQRIHPDANQCFKISRDGSSPSAPVTLAVSGGCAEIPARPIAPPTPPAPPAPLRLPTLASFPATKVISAPGKLPVVIFATTMESFPIGCQAVRNLWSGLRTEEVSLEQYNNVLNPKPNQPGFISIKGGDLHCNAPNAVKAYTSPLFGTYAGAIVTDGKPFFVASPEFFTAMGIKPVQLNDQQASDFVNNSRFSSTLLTTNK